MTQRSARFCTTTLDAYDAEKLPAEGVRDCFGFQF